MTRKKKKVPAVQLQDAAAPAAETIETDQAPAGNAAAEDSLDAAAARMGLSDADAEAPDAPTRTGRPRGAKGRGPSKDEWRSRAKRAEAQVRAREAEEQAAAAQMNADQVAEAARSLQGPIEMTVRWWTGKQAEAKGPHWIVSDQEATALAGAWANALAPWAGYIAKYAPIGLALTVTIETFRPRLKIDRENAKRAAADADAAPDGQHR